MTIYFYSTREKPYGCFSNFSAHGFLLDRLWWPTSEHFFQAQKFVNTDRQWYEKIQMAKSPRDAAKMGRNRSHPLDPNWEQIKDEVMRRGVRQKFTTHPDLKEILLGTGDEELVENSPIDYYWGCGADGSGKNKLGQVLMIVREELRQQES